MKRNLTLKEKYLFKLPLQLKQKGSAEGMRIWIEQAEMIFQQKDQDNHNNLDIKTWFFPQSKAWLKKPPNIIRKQGKKCKNDQKDFKIIDR